ncbi:hypothetical protein [Prosthecochloris vibrioformis]|uniref:Uncharacterized protein n=1 Tax=Prosthecochloris vibrioformis TaxID=1098 RepID=A0A5C4RYD9_PROVB|nr:hypothetical protein [Prosthecochloris vibrioformis]TNJ36130.1 hypothetical protein FGF68_08845 [Prosthecochloris vibrioformis]
MDKKTMIALVAAAVMGISGSAFAYGPDVEIDDAAAAQTGGVAAGDDVTQTEVDVDAAAAQYGGVAAGDDATSIEVEKKDVDIASNNTTEIDVEKDVDVEKNMLSNNDTDVDVEKNLLSNNDTDVDVEKNMLSNNDTDVDTDFMSNNEWDQDNSTNVDVQFDDLSLGLAFASKGSIALAAGGDMDVNAAIAENESRQENDFSGLDNITVRNGVQDKVTTETTDTEGYWSRCNYHPATTEINETVIPGSSMAAVTARQSDVNIGSGIGMNINGAFVQATNSASALAINGNSNLTSGNQ